MSPKTVLDHDVATALAELGAALAATDPWWIIGSAAMALHGARSIKVADIDLLLSPADARRFLKRHDAAIMTGEPSSRFRSEVFGQWHAAALTVDVMGGFHVRTGSGWQEVHPETREEIRIDGIAVYVPSISELITLCQLFDRPKDYKRQRLLQELLV